MSLSKDLRLQAIEQNLNTVKVMAKEKRMQSEWDLKFLRGETLQSKRRELNWPEWEGTTFLTKEWLGAVG